MSSTIDFSINQEDFIDLISKRAVSLEINVDEDHYSQNSEYYWKNKGQFISVLNKGLGDDKLKVIFQTHIQKINNSNTNNVESCESVEYWNITKIITTPKYSVYTLI